MASSEESPNYCRENEKSGSRGVTLALRVQPRSSRIGPLGPYGDAAQELRWGVSAAPVEGKANEELLKGVARFFGIAKSKVSLISGSGARSKVLVLEGVSSVDVVRKIEKEGKTS